jgi:ATP-dependent exoDNAse (exonuclease V) beta subunit
MHQQRRNTLELDSINLLYVTLTRAVEQLYIFSEMPSKLNLEEPDDFRQLLIAYLTASGHWNPDQMIYSFGSLQRTLALPSEEKKQAPVLQITLDYVSSTPEDHQLFVASSEASLWQTDAEIAIDIGNLFHDTMELIHTKSDLEHVLGNYRKRGVHPEKTIDLLETIITQILEHPEVKHLYDDQLSHGQIFNERDIITSQHEILRPDRLNFFENNTVTITDYKTGAPNKKHEHQLEIYSRTLQEMGLEIANKFLIYSRGDTISINKI